MNKVYQPWIRALLRTRWRTPEDADDICQATLLVAWKKLDKFEHKGPGSFRAWLRSIFSNEARRFWRDSQRKPAPAAGGTDNYSVAAQVEDPVKPLEEAFDREYNSAVLAGLLRSAEENVDPLAVQIYRLVVLEGFDREEAARRHRITVQQVYGACFRVNRFLRERGAELLDLDQ